MDTGKLCTGRITGTWTSIFLVAGKRESRLKKLETSMEMKSYSFSPSLSTCEYDDLRFN